MTARQTYPGVAEIAKAFENDPRTKLANTVLAQGTSTAPVAGGGWAWVDGISRALQGALGGHMSRQQLKKYAADEAELLASAKADGEAGIASMTPQPVAPPVPAPTPAVAAPAPAQPPQGAPGGMDPQAVAAALSAPSQPPQAPPSAGPSIAGVPNAPMQPGGAAPLPTPNGYARKSQGVAFTDPLGGKGGRPSSGYGPRKAPVEGASTFHNGLDIPVAEGTPVQAAAEGEVIAAWNDTANGGGLSVRVRHPDGSVTGYAHLSSLGVKKGDTVWGGQPIGAAGKTGRATGSHLHFTVRDPSGKRVDPSTLKFSAGGEVPTSPDAPSGAGTGGQPAPEVELPVPEAVERPEVPTAEAATQSPKLRRAYEMLKRGNKYEYDRAMRLMEDGLAEQGQFDEKAAGRRQNITDATYQNDLGMFADDKRTRLNDTLTENRSVRERNWNVNNREDTQRFTAGENAADRSFRASQAELERNFTATQNELNRNAQLRQAMLQINASKATREEKAEAKRNAFYQSPTGVKVMTQFQTANKALTDLGGALDQFEAANKQSGTGGLWGNLVPFELQKSMSAQKEIMINASNSIAQVLASDLKGALSDKDVAFIQTQVPSVTNGGKTNQAAIKRIRGVLTRASEYQQAYVQSAIENDATFPARWAKYTNSVPPGSKVTFEEYSNARTVKF